MSNVLQSLKTQSSRVLGRMTSLGNGSNNNNNNNNGDSNTNNEDDNGMELQPPQSMNQKNNIKNTPRSGGSFQRLFGGNDSEKNGNDDDDDDDDEENDSQQEILMEENENENENENSWTEELSNYCPKLNFRERLIGFVSCFGLGYLIAFFSFRFFIKLMEGHPIPFAINYTTGHVLQLLSSMFLCGPKRQFRLMFDQTRYVTSVVYLSCLVSTLILIFIPMVGGLKLLLLLIFTLSQFVASCWYSLSYIPYGRRTALRLIQKYTIGNSSGIIEPSNNEGNTNSGTFLGRFSLGGGTGNGGTGGGW